MKFKLDEHLPVEFADDLRQAGHDAMTVIDQGLSGSDDGSLMRVVQAESRVMLTMDKGIANVTAYPPARFLESYCFDHSKRVVVLCYSSSASIGPWSKLESCREL